MKEVQFSKTFGRDNKKNLWCTYCKKTGHTKETCWKLHGKPREGNQRGGQQPQQPRHYGQATLSIGQQGQEPNLMQTDLKEEIEKLKGMIMVLEKSGGVKSGGCSLALSGKYPISLGINVSDKDIRNSWVIDSGATDHMAHSSLLFTTYTPCPSNQKIAMADGSLTTVAGIGDVCISELLTLRNVLHVPKLSTNLISIQSLHSI